MTLVDLPVDHPRRGGGGSRGSRTLLWPGGTAQELNAAAQQVGATPARVALAALAALLHRYTGQEEIAPGVVCQGNPAFADLARSLSTDTIAHAQVTFAYGESAALGDGTELALSVTVEAGGLRLTAGYDAALFEAGTVDRLLGHYQTLLAGAIRNPALPVGHLPLLTGAERSDLTAWAGTAPDYPREYAIPRLFEEQVRLAPDRVAVVFGDRRLTYGELNRRANRLAHQLRVLGVGPDQLVSICVERSPELIIGLLAILKAGGAYVPLDPTYPQDRLAFMLQDSASPVLLTQSHLQGKLPAHGARVICLDQDQGEGVEANPDAGVRPRHLAYVSYTSGSTGRPKGVLVPHRAVVRLVRNTNYADLGPEQVFLQLAPVPFDASTLEIWGALLNGGRLVVMPPQQPTLDELARALVEHRVTVLWLTAGLFHLMVEHHLEALLSVRQVLAGGDVLSVPHVRKVLAGLKPGHTLINGYGPTENTTFTCCFPMTGETQFAGSVPIGRPIANTQCYILDPYLQMVPQGVAGELYIGGDGLAHGYLNRPDLTEERFLETSYGRLYRTGDRVRWLPDGTVEFLGRTDNQVKIRGFRIELGEIEFHLAQHPAVADCVVVAREEGPGDKRLVAYVVGTTLPGTRHLRTWLQERLPAYMIPSAFVVLESFPLNPNGKVDRKALPAPDYAAEGVEYVAPRTPVEEALAAIWAQLLRAERVGVMDDFFTLGGHSLLATQVLSRVREQFGVELPLPLFFEAPTVAGLAERIAGEATRRKAPPMLPVDRSRPLPLSFAQARLWFFDQLTPQSPLYNVAEAIRLTGTLDAKRLEASLNLLVARHEALRTNFVTRGREPVQVIRPELRLTLPVIPATESEIEALVRAEARRPFDLAADPLIRATLVRLAPDDHLLLLTVHHIVTDGWSMGVLYAELGQIYEALRAGREPDLPPLPLQYADFTQWQRTYLTGETLDEQLAYWTRELAGAPTVLELPADRPRPALQSFRGAKRSLPLPADLVAKLHTLSQGEGATPFMTMLAAFQVLLHRYSGQEDLLAGVAIANRNRAETEGLIGFFVNTLAMRADFSGQPTFRQFLQQVRRRALGAFAHQDLPLERVVEALQPGRDPSRAPLLQVLFALQNAPMDDLLLDGIRLTNLEPTGVDTGTAKYDLILTVEEAGGVTRAVAEYCTDLYAEATIGRFLGHYVTLLTAITADPDQPVATLPLLTPAEERQLLTEWSGIRTDYPQTTVHALLTEQARLRPEQPAVIYGDAQLTYGELNRRSNQLARRLRRLGVGRDTLVAVCAEKSPELIMALAAVLKAGGAYVPMDPEHPEERLAFMLADSQAPVLLTHAALRAKLPAEGVEVICLDRDWADIGRESDWPLEEINTPDDYACAIYTSGSTGKPKGAGLPHRGVVRLVRATNYMTLTADDRMAQVANLSFDAATWEIWGALLGGGTLVGIPKEVALAPDRLADEISRQGITAMLLTTALLNQVARERPEAVGSLRTLLFGGEACDVRAVRAILEAGGPERRLVHAYGPTESTTLTTCHHVTQVEEGAVTVPIGVPVANTTVYVVDANLQPVPVGVPGELLTGGDGLARAYIGRPELTAERFVQTPWGRCYRTGDVVRWRADGTLEFIGRRDNQVKLRGFRIELGEIEAVLTAHPAVAEALVMAREDGGTGKRLVAYLTLAPGAATGDQPDLRAYLKERLPDYMVPSAFVTLDAFPLTPNGKVDRRALPVPEFDGSAGYVAPRTALEESLAAVFAEVLELERVSIHDRFFEVGGHSLLATRAVSRMREALRLEVPLRLLFEHQTVADLAAVLGRQAVQGVADLPIRPAPREGKLPLSFAQQRLWFFDQLTPDTALYNVPEAIRLTGTLNAPVLEESLTLLAARHEVLRTNFVTQGREPVQVIHPTPSIRLQTLTAATEAEAERLMREEARRPFHLTADALIRATLVRLGDSGQEHLLLITLHHIIADGWSLGVLFTELAELYTALLEGRAPTLPALPLQYADFAAWQREYLSGEALQKQIDWWKQELNGAPAVLALPTDKPRPAVQSYAGHRVSRPLPPSLVAKLHTLSRGEGATLFMTLLAAFQTLLHRYTGQTDLLAGSAIAGRNRAETEGLIGFFVNTLPMRATFDTNPTFRQLLQQVKERSLGAFAHQDLPLEKLVEVLQPERNLSHSPLVQVLFALQNAPMAGLHLPGITAAELVPGGVHPGSAKYDLVLTVEEAGGASHAMLEYATDLFEEATAHRLLSHYENLLDALAADPDRPVSALPLLTPAEERQVLVEWNQTRTGYPEAPVHELFARQARLRPDAVAVVYGDERLTYGELDRRSSQLAQRLRRMGVGPDVLVGLCLERSPALIEAMLAILKAGGAYLPLDPDYPADRLAFMLADGQAPVLLTQESLADRLPATDAAVILLDRDWAEIATEPAEASANLNRPDDLIYVIYTSGSTGRPKGTAIPHRGVVRLLFETNYIQLSSADRIAQASNASFDAATFEIWGALLHGGTLVGIPKEVALSPTLLADVLRRERITTLFLTTALFNQIARERPGAFGTLDSVLFGGEACDVRAVRAVLQAGGPQRLLHVYGPTETTTFATWYHVTDVPADAVTVPIGCPISNTTCFVLDARRNPVPVGVPGELYIGGDGLAREYLNQPGLTGERFVTTPYGRLYRTGDLVRLQADGAIEFLGRLDHQVKIRGFRIELGEIETALTAHPAVAEALVMAREEGPAGKRLVAYVVPQGDALTAAELRPFLKERLPDYMVPAAFVLMDAFPLTPNGKVDRKALPAPDGGDDLTGAGSFVAPRTPLEEALAAIFAEVLGLERISVHAHFFDLGGHSLLATQAVSRMREALKVELPLRTFFERATVAELAETLADADAELPAPPIRPVPREGELPLSFAQQRLWFLDEWEPGLALYNVPTAHRLSGPLDHQALQQSLTAIAARHESLRTTFERVGGRPVQVIHPAAAVPLPLTDLSHLDLPEAEAEAERLARAEGQTPFDLRRGPLLRAGLIRLAEGEHVLLITMHHIISDGWSMKVLMDELAACYAAYTAGREPALQPLPVQYADYAVWQQQWLAGDELERQASYWRRQLAGAPTVLELPTDRPRPPVLTHRGRRKSFDMPPALTEALTDLSRREGTTLFMTLLAAWSVLLHRYARQEEVVVGTPVAGRNRQEIEGLAGFFVNTLALRLNLGGEPSFADLLRRTKETSLGAYSHQDLPFEKLVEMLHPDRNMSYTPLFQVMFALQETYLGDLALPGLTARLLEPDTGTAKFDLGLEIFKSPDGLKATLEWATDLFDEATIDRLSTHFVTLLEGVVRDPATPVSRLPLMPEAERALVVAQWNRTEQPYPRYLCLHDLVERQVKATPGAIALVCGDQSLTYAELNGRANQLARYLQKLGVGPDLPVGISMERTPDLAVALLGILKAGGAYLPLDPTYPQERLAYMLEHSQAPVLLTRGEAPVAFGGHTVDLLRDWPAIARESSEGIDGGARPEHIAYIIYTSGSTGLPKGVAVEHRNVVNLLSSFRQWPGMTAADRTLAVTSISFDIHVVEFFLTLSTGARIVLATREEAQDGRRLAALMAQHGVTVAQGTPATWRLLLEGGWQSYPGLKLFVGGEALPKELAQRVTEGGGTLFNLYGPTETTVYSTGWQVDGGPILIGRPIANTRVYVLDSHLNPVPVGVPGEMYIGGDGLARGYLHRPDLTAERFIDSPFGRVYKTGDLVRLRADSQIDYLGRVDFQVKVRGFRIELGEIEAVLERHPAVAQAAAAVWEAAPGDRRIAAHVVLKGEGEPPSAADLRAHLKERLPEYMIPATFTTLEALPLTPSGKVDRKALPRPEAAAGGDRVYTAPRTPVEEALAAIWSQVLEVSPVSLDDNYFELGGDSIRSIRVRALAEEQGLALHLQDLFRHPTLRELAAVVGGAEGTEAAQADPQADPQAPPFALLAPEDPGALPAGLEDAYPATHLQAAMLLSSLTLAETYRNVTGYVLRLPFDADALRRAAAQMVRRHAILRTAFDLVSFSEPLQLVHPTAELPLEVADLRGAGPEAADEEMDRWVKAELQRVWDWSRPPLARLAVHRLTAESFRLSVSFHHAILDGWSVTAFLAELIERYQAALEGRDLEAAPTPARLRDYVALERQALESDATRTYWQEQLREFEPAVPFGAPAAEAGRPVQNQYIEVDIEPAVSDALQELARQNALPLKSLLLGAHLRVLAEATGRFDVMTGLVTNGRPEVAGGDELLGLFLNTVPFRLKLAGGTWLDLARQALAAETALLPHRRFPLAEMETGRGGQPPVEIYFNYTNFRVGERAPAVEDVVNAAWSSFPLAAEFYMDAMAGRLRIFVEYDSHRFRRDQAEALGLCYRRALAALAGAPGEPHAAPLLTDAERAAATQAPPPQAPAATRAVPEPAGRIAPDMDPETAALWLERIDELSENEIEMLLAILAEKEAT